MLLCKSADYHQRLLIGVKLAPKCGIGKKSGMWPNKYAPLDHTVELTSFFGISSKETGTPNCGFVDKLFAMIGCGPRH